MKYLAVFSASIVLIALSVLSGCATYPPKAFAHSKKEIGYTQKLTHIILVAPEFPRYDGTNVWPAIAEKLRVKGVQTELVTSDTLELNKGQKLRDAIKRTGVGHVLVNNATEMTKQVITGGYRSSKEATEVYEASIVSTTTGATIWRAKLHMGYTRIVAGEREEVFATALLDKLVSDKLL